MAAMESTQQFGGHAVLESPTGTGKTIAALVAALSSKQQDGRTILYATRTNSQQTQVIAEHRRLRESGQDPGLLVPLMGRRHHCPLMADDPKFADGTSEELGRLCRDAKRKATRAFETGIPVLGACSYFQKFLKDGTEPVEALLRSATSSESLGQQVAEAGSCPHEALKAILPRADLILMPVVYLVDDALRNALGTWIGRDLGDCHVIVDEAHHLPDAARSHHSVRLGQITIQRAVKEAENQKDPVLGGRVLATSFLLALQRAMQDMADEYILEDATDAKIPGGALEERLMEDLRVPSTIIERIAIDLETWGDIVRDEQQSKGKLPRSYLGSIGTFLRMWWLTRDSPYAHLIEGDPLAIEAALLDASDVLGWLPDCGSSVHMSGTLSPGADFVQLTGLPADTQILVIADPYESNQLDVVGIQGVHRRWQEHKNDPSHGERLQETATRILAGITGRTAIWFPSYAMMQDYLEEGFLHETAGSVYVERQDMTQQQLLKVLHQFANDSHSNALLLGVLGGRLTEGIDYPGDLLENVLILGIPYPRPTARLQALIHHQDLAYDGQGWTMSVHNPVGRVVRQAVGRLVRGPDDRGRAFILDERVTRFRGHLSNLRMANWTNPLEPSPSGNHEFMLASQTVSGTPIQKTQSY
jgi:DNA excision repair protein ERCC-2